MISFDLDEDQRLIAETARSFARDRIRPALRDCERAGEVSAPLRREFEELGLALLDVPESLGGAGQSALTAAVVHEELSWGDAGCAVALFRTQPVVAALLELANDAQRKRFFAALAKPACTGAIALSEPGSAEGPLFGTRARRDGDFYVLDGSKSSVLFGGQAQLTIVFAAVDGEPEGWAGAGAFVVEGGTSASRKRTLGLNAVSIADVTYANVRVPAANRLRGGDDFAAATRRFLARYALITAARQVGLARAAYEHARQYSEERKAFGKPIAHFQEIAFFLADMHMDVESSRWLVWRAARALDTQTPDWQTSVAKAAAHTSDAAWTVADRAVQILGGAGYMCDHPVEKWMRDTKTLALFGTPSEGHLETIAATELGQAAEVPIHPRLQAAVT